MQVIPKASQCAPSPSGDWWRKRGVAKKETFLIIIELVKE